MGSNCSISITVVTIPVYVDEYDVMFTILVPSVLVHHAKTLFYLKESRNTQTPCQKREDTVTSKLMQLMTVQYVWLV